jgi:hypothetical protein
LNSVTLRSGEKFRAVRDYGFRRLFRNYDFRDYDFGWRENGILRDNWQDFFLSRGRNDQRSVVRDRGHDVGRLVRHDVVRLDVLRNGRNGVVVILVLRLAAGYGLAAEAATERLELSLGLTGETQQSEHCDCDTDHRNSLMVL